MRALYLLAMIVFGLLTVLVLTGLDEARREGPEAVTGFAMILFVVVLGFACAIGAFNGW